MCDVCTKAFTQSHDLKRHKRIHSSHKPFVCSLCSKAFTQNGQLKIHMIIHKTSAGYQTADTKRQVQHSLPPSAIYATPSSLDRPDVCQNSSSDFVKNDSAPIHSLKKHAVSSDGGQHQTVCVKSPETDGSVGELGKGTHEEKDRVRRHACDMCSRAFTKASNLEKHKRIHTGYKPFVCDVCSKAFVQTSDLKRHKRIHNGHGPRLCQTAANTKAVQQASACDENSNIKIQIVSSRGEEQYSVSPEVSGLDCNAGNHVDATGNEKDAARRHGCDKCSKVYLHAGSLKKHKMTHSGHKPFVCYVCSKAFTGSHDLKRHKRIHTGHRPFLCDVCGWAFTQMGHLKDHKRTHTGYNPFLCDVCSKQFTRAHFLKAHKVSHTGLRPYVCEVCKKTFTQFGTLKAHKKTKHTGYAT